MFFASLLFGSPQRPPPEPAPGPTRRRRSRAPALTGPSPSAPIRGPASWPVTAPSCAAHDRRRPQEPRLGGGSDPDDGSTSTTRSGPAGGHRNESSPSPRSPRRESVPAPAATWPSPASRNAGTQSARSTSSRHAQAPPRLFQGRTLPTRPPPALRLHPPALLHLSGLSWLYPYYPSQLAAMPTIGLLSGVPPMEP